MLVKSDFLPPLGRSKSRNLHVEKVLAWIITEFSSEIIFAFRYFNKWILSLICVLPLEGVEQLTYTIFKIQILRQGYNLGVHMGSFLELERTVSLEEEIVHLLSVDDVIKKEISKHFVIVLYIICKLEWVSYVALRHDKEMLITYRSFRHRNVKVLWLRPYDKISINALVLEAEPAVFIFLHLHTFHLEVDSQKSSLKCQLLILSHESLSFLNWLEFYKAIGLHLLLLLLAFAPTTTSTLANLLSLLSIEVIELGHSSMFLDKLLNLLLRYLFFKAWNIDEVVVALINATILLMLSSFSLWDTSSFLLLTF